ncbi:MAG: RNA 2',3'-cyclic phosphodiesterase [Anaerolineae bacterium]|nr:MAG: RNA 2',3'-cyclic phosphodiesterase [Anaerolineae bacterium]
MEQIRTFIAIELSRELQDSLGRIQDELKRQVSERSVRWVKPEGVHLTLKFLGDVPAPRVASVSQAVESACLGFGPFAIELAGLGCFPNLRRPRVVWVGVGEPTGTLARLQRAVESALAGLGFEPEGRSFKPHLTLGRVQHRVGQGDRERLGELIAGYEAGRLGDMLVAAVNVMRSDLRPGGAVYTALARVPLQGRRR